MTARRLRNSLWALTAAVALVTVLGWRLGAAEMNSAIRPMPSGARDIRRVSPDSLRSAAHYVTAHDPFRVDHHPSPLPYRPELEGTASGAPPPPPPKPAKPRLALSGIVGGPPWTALLDSVPGRDGSVLVRKGDTIGKLKIRSIGRDTVIVQGADTVWRLIVKRPWQ